MIERRAHERHRVFRLGVKVATRDAFRASYLRDLSEGGLFVRSQHPLPLGSQVAIELAPPNHPVLSLLGKVVRREDTGFGVQFGDLDPAVKAAIDALLAEYQEAPSPTEADSTALIAEIADLKGSVEAYEEELARLRESETALLEKLELSEAEKKVLEDVVTGLQSKAEELEYERAKMTALLSEAADQVTRLQAEAVTEGQRANDLANEMAASKEMFQELKAEHAKDVKRQLEELRVRSKKELDAATTQRAALMAELRTMQQQLQDGAFTKLRDELRDVSSQLDEEKMKTMALQKALERFVAMGGGK
ncbi:MAG: PilZ domain-containing protein [Myxococcaceae bacterium]